MNLNDLHKQDKAISAISLFKSTEGTVTSIHILANEQLKEHLTKIPALLICINGEAVFENENGLSIPLSSGDYINIEPFIKHWINAKTTANFILIK